jgi:uncharacterized hydrophobic protein (TIGR00271 family)
MRTLVIVTEPSPTEAVLRWAARFRKDQIGALEVLCCHDSESRGDGAEGETGAREDSGEVLVAAAREAQVDVPVSRIELLEGSARTLGSSVIRQVRERRATLLVVAYDARKPLGDFAARLAARLLRATPCDVIVLDVGRNTGAACERIVAPLGGLHSKFALQVARGLIGQGSALIPLMVGHYFGEDSEDVAQRELNFELRDAGIERSVWIRPRIVLDRTYDDAVRVASRTSHLLVTGASSLQDLRRLRGEDDESADAVVRPELALALVRPARVFADSVLPEPVQRVLRWLPVLEPAGRLELFDRIQAGTRWNADFIVMIGLSTAIATMGLLQSSTAVVIGAMVVAPLMTPLIGTGLAIVQGNLRLLKTSLRTMSLGVVTGLFLGFSISFVVPGDGATLEVLARGAPNVLDLAVAFLSGAAAGYALARPNVLAAMAGVAIAAALVPPLATVGIALAEVQWTLAKGAAILLLTNLVAISLGSASVFRLLGVRPGVGGEPSSRWTGRIALVMSLVLVGMAAPLGYEYAEQISEGQARPTSYPLSVSVGKALAERIEQEPGVRLFLAGRKAVEYREGPGTVFIVLVSATAIRAEFKQELVDLVRTIRGKPTLSVDVLCLAMAPEEPVPGD